MTYTKYYQDRVSRRGKTSRERNFKQKLREFERFFENSLTKDVCLIDGVEEDLIFQDHSQSNNKDLSDDKYVIAKNSTVINVGSYVDWRKTKWLVFTEEHKTIPTHQQLKVKIVNETIKWIINGKISNNSLGWGAYVQSQTLYTLGVSTGPHIANVDSKMMMYMQANEETSTLKTDNRIFVGSKVYKIKFTDRVSRPGLINYLMEEDTIGPYDNVDLRIADYYKVFEKDVNETVNPKPDPVKITIVGETSPKISQTYTYKLSDDTIKVSSWSVESIGNDVGYYITDNNKEKLTLQFKNDFRYVGDIVNIIVHDENNNASSLTLLISKRF